MYDDAHSKSFPQINFSTSAFGIKSNERFPACFSMLNDYGGREGKKVFKVALRLNEIGKDGPRLDQSYQEEARVSGETKFFQADAGDRRTLRPAPRYWRISSSNNKKLSNVADVRIAERSYSNGSEASEPH